MQRPQRVEDGLHAACATVSYSGGGAGHRTSLPARYPPGQQELHNKETRHETSCRESRDAVPRRHAAVWLRRR
ncbi:protein of unknown function [Cupriavidus taiwanensis]|nr:protein of unknown function [Cupriavidus taiwanensis]